LPRGHLENVLPVERKDVESAAYVIHDDGPVIRKGQHCAEASQENVAIIAPLPSSHTLSVLSSEAETGLGRPASPPRLRLAQERAGPNFRCPGKA